MSMIQKKSDVISRVHEAIKTGKMVIDYQTGNFHINGFDGYASDIVDYYSTIDDIDLKVLSETIVDSMLSIKDSCSFGGKNWEEFLETLYKQIYSLFSNLKAQLMLCLFSFSILNIYK